MNCLSGQQAPADKNFKNLDKSWVFEIWGFVLQALLRCREQKIPIWLSMGKKKTENNFFYLKAQENTGYKDGLVS